MNLFLDFIDDIYYKSKIGIGYTMIKNNKTMFEIELQIKHWNLFQRWLNEQFKN